jgi:dihydropteroate synthase
MTEIEDRWGSELGCFMMSRFWKHLLPGFGQETLIMGVVNVTPDSFSDGGHFLDPGAAIAQGLKLVAAGAQLIDVGGESTRPGAESIVAGEELDRVLPVIKALAEEVVVSIDTNKSVVAAAAVDAGAKIVNDISGGRFDPEILDVVAKHDLGYILMHTRERPESMQQGSWQYEGGVVQSVLSALKAGASTAVLAGIKKDRLMIDPGFGFGKTVEENCQLLGRLDRFVDSGYPVLIGTSRKSFLGKLTGRGVDHRVYASCATVAMAALAGVAMVRVHDVAATQDVLAVVNACARSRLYD